MTNKVINTYRLAEGGVSLLGKKERGTDRSKRKGPVELKSTTQHAVLWVVAVTVGALILLQSFKEFVASVYYYSLVGLGASPMTGLLII
ncbi:MAG: hypothetical protein JW939_06800, partial [Candidatus Thermoplasmatota archaeon]|nr:hypothetical protein [Candidatus Thermoplasmatota archaeon]